MSFVYAELLGQGAFSLHELEPDSNPVELPIPVIEPYMLIGAVSFHSKEILLVEVAESEINIRRKDGRKLQIKHIEDAGEPWQKEHIVLSNPVGKLVLRNSTEAGLWHVTTEEELEVVDSLGLERFLAKIALYGPPAQKRALSPKPSYTPVV